MKTILIVAVIAGVACREPAPQAPVPTRTEHKTPPPPPPTGRLEVVQPHGVVKPHGTHPPMDLEQTYGPVIASGIESGRPWSLRGSIGARGAATFFLTTTGGGGGRGALPFQDLRWKKLGHFGGISSGEHGSGAARTFSLSGVVSKQIATIEARLADGTSLPVQIIDTGDPRANFFVAVWSTPFPWEVMIARDAAGAELETYRQPQSPPTPTQASATQASATQASATQASATSTP